MHILPVTHMPDIPPYNGPNERVQEGTLQALGSVPDTAYLASLSGTDASNTSSSPSITSRLPSVPSFSHYVQPEISALLRDFEHDFASTNATVHKPSASARSLQRRWRECLKHLRIQWQMVNYVAAVLVGALITMLQDPVVSSNSLSQPMATVGLLCALASLCWGVVLYIHVARCRKLREAHCWLTSALRIRSIWWNIETMLSLPLAWLLWSASLFCLAILTAYAWNLDVGMQPAVISQIFGAIAVAVWTGQVPLVVWTLKRLGRPLCSSEEPMGLDPMP